MSSSNHFSLGDMYHSLDEATALDHIDGASAIVAFQNIGSMLFAGDSGVPHFIHTTPEFLLRGGRPTAPVVIEEVQRLPSSRPTAARINDELVLLMKKPIELPSLDLPQPQDEVRRVMPTRHFGTQGSIDMGRGEPLTLRAREFPISSQRRPTHVKRSSHPESYQTPSSFQNSAPLIS